MANRRRAETPLTIVGAEKFRPDIFHFHTEHYALLRRAGRERGARQPRIRCFGAALKQAAAALRLAKEDEFDWHVRSADMLGSRTQYATRIMVIGGGMKEENGIGDLLDPIDFGALCKMRKHSVSVAGHRTSVSLEDAFWYELRRIANARGQTVSAIVEEIDRRRSHNLSGSLRVFVLHAIGKSVASKDVAV